MAPCQKQKAFQFSYILLETQLPCEFGGSTQYSPYILPNLRIYKGSASWSLRHFCESGGTPSSDSECFGSQNQSPEHLWPSCRNSLPLVRLPPRIYPLASDKRKGNKDSTQGHCQVVQVSPCNSFHSRIPNSLTPNWKQNFGKSVMQQIKRWSGEWTWVQACHHLASLSNQGEPYAPSVSSSSGIVGFLFFGLTSAC